MIINLSHHPMTVKDPHPRAWPNKYQVIPIGWWMDNEGNVRELSPSALPIWRVGLALADLSRIKDEHLLS